MLSRVSPDAVSLATQALESSSPSAASFLQSPDTSPSAHAIGMAPPMQAARPLQRFAWMCFPGQPALTFAPERSRAKSGARVPPDAEAELLDRAAARTSTAGSARRAERSHGSSLRWTP